MQLNAHSQVGARFKLIVRKAHDDSIARETDWFCNLVLDTGLARMSAGTWISQCCVGTGNSTPVVTQTALDSFLASTSTQQSSSAGVQTSTTPYYRWAKVTWRFGQGVAAGNISEVGLGWGNSNLWNRALIKDANGDPTTITVLSDEYLDVVSEVRDYPAQSISGSFNLLDKTGAVISTHTVTGKPVLTGANAAFLQIIGNEGNNYGAFNVYSGEMGSTVTALPSGSLTNDQLSGMTVTYPTSTSIRIVGTLDLSKANGTHQSFDLMARGLLTDNYTTKRYQFQISPTITKTSSQIMTYTLEMSWGRYTG